MTYRTDSEIKTDILAEMKFDPQIDETDIGVIVKDGAVTLTGNVPFYFHKAAAMNATKKIKGVRAVADEIKVRTPREMQGSDEDIAHKISELTENSYLLNNCKIQAEVRNGIVTLTGEADWNYQKNYIFNQVEALKGVKLIINSINIRKRASKDDIRKEITRALHRHAGLEADRVQISVHNGVVTLSGNADNLIERDCIIDAAWSVPGVTSVVDEIEIRTWYSKAA